MRQYFLFNCHTSQAVNFQTHVTFYILIHEQLIFSELLFKRKSATSFFAAYDALCEEGTATPVCKALDEVADISVPGNLG